MSHSKIFRNTGFVLAGIGLAGCALSTQLQSVSCQVQSVLIGAAETSFALPGTHLVQGEALVDCSSGAAQDQTIEVALLSRLAPNIVLSFSGRASSAALQMQLFQDEGRLYPIAVQGAGLPEVLRQVRVPAQSQVHLSIPFFAQIVVPEVTPAGTYSAESNLSVFIRSKP